MTFTANQVTSITVKDRDGVTKGILEGKVGLRGGDGIRIDVEDKTLTLNAGAIYNEQDSRYQRKFAVVINGGTFIDDDGTVMEFSGMPYYLASLGGVKGDFVNNFDFLSNACGQVGIPRLVSSLESSSSSSSHSSQSNSSSSSSDKSDLSSSSSLNSSSSQSSGMIIHDPYVLLLNDDGELELLDICQACIDCEDYAQIVMLMDRVEEWQNGDVNRNLDEGVNLFRQVQAAMHYWNYQVHMKCFPLVAISGNEIFFVVKSGYYNKGTTDFSPTQRYIFDVEWEDLIGSVEIKITDAKSSDGVDEPTIVYNKVSDTQYEAVVTYSAVGFNQRSLYELVFLTDQRMYAAEFEVTWVDTHAGEDITKEREGLIR